MKYECVTICCHTTMMWFILECIVPHYHTRMRSLILGCIVTILLLSVPSARGSLDCSKCLRGSSLVCPDYDDRQFEVKVKEFAIQKVSFMLVECAYVDEANFSLMDGCSFPSVNFIKFNYCPLTNDSFADNLHKIGLHTEKVESLSVYHPLSGGVYGIYPHHLKGLGNLTYLNLETTHLNEISNNLFFQTPKLMTLNLRGNDLQSLEANLFQPLTNLTILTLSNNNLSSLASGLFDNLKELAALTLWKNKLTSLPPNIFDNLVNLQNLTLQDNQLLELDENLLSSNPNLQKVIFKKNNLTGIPDELFVNCSKLKLVVFANNQLKSLPEDLFENSYQNLEEVDIAANFLEKLSGSLFQNARNLKKVILSKNRLVTLPKTLFSSSEKLERLDLSSNLISSLPVGIFDSTVNLNMLNLNGNKLVTLEQNLLVKCINLAKLFVRDNQLTSLSFNTFPSHSDSSLKEVNFASNNLTAEAVMTLGSFALNNQLHLEDINFSNNQFEHFPSDASFFIFLKLKELNFRSNFIKSIHLDDMVNLANGIQLDFRDNMIKTVYSATDTGTQFDDKTVKVYLSGNNLVCNCNNFRFIKELQTSKGRHSRLTYDVVSDVASPKVDKVHVVRVLDEEKLSCVSPMSLQGTSLSQLNLFQLTCDVPPKNCSPKCPCTFRPADNMILVDCSGLGLTIQPNITLLPRFNYTLNLTNNRLSSFHYAKSQPIVNLSLKGNLFTPHSLSNMTHLPPNLLFLDLRHNNLTHLDYKFLKHLNKTDAEVDLNANPWTCDCDIKDLHDFVQTFYKKVKNLRKVTCVDSGVALMDLTEEDICPYLLQPMVVTTIAIIAVLLVLFAVLGTVSFYRYKTRIKVWMYAHQTCLWLVTEEEIDVDKEYDAFISYSHKDETFVNQHLLPGLEKGDPQYKVCLHYRDWVAGEMIQQQILDSVQSSRRTLVVLSPNFLESDWGQMEFRAAHEQALQDRTNRVIIIVYGDLPSEDLLDKRLLDYVKLRTYLKWGDSRFWDNLRYAMPHPKHLLPAWERRRRGRKGRSKKIDVVELVNGHAHSMKNTNSVNA